MDKSEPLPLKRIPIDKLTLAPEKMQFRSFKSATGEVDSHKLDGEWNAMALGTKPLIVLEHKNEKGEPEYIVADGHHRTAFAKRLAAEGKPGPKELDAYVLEESKGWNMETAKIAAAFADEKFARGEGDVLEEARAIKESRSNANVKKEFLPALQMDKGNLKLAVKFSGLSNESLDKIQSGEVPVEAAKEVVDRVKDASRHDQVIAIVGEKLKQEYPNYRPNKDLAATLASKANDNHKWQDRIKAERAETSYSLGA